MQKHSSELVSGFLKYGHHITLLFSVDSAKHLPAKNEVCEKLKISDSSNFTCKAFHFPKTDRFPGHYIRESHLLSSHFFDYIKKEVDAFDLIFAQGFTAWRFLEEKKKGVKIPLTGIHFHGLNMFQKTFGWKAGLIARMMRVSVRKNLAMADIVFSYGGKFGEIYRNLGIEKKCLFQPIGIEASEIEKAVTVSSGKVKFIFIGRNDKVKGLDLLHQVISKIKVDLAEFNFIGAIPEEIRLRRTDCIYHGLVSDEDKNRILEHSDVLICSSFSEGMPYVILEAMAKGLAIISTDVGAISEMVNDQNGILIPAADEQKLLEAINIISESQTEKLNLKKHASLIKSTQFEWSKIIDDFSLKIGERIYENPVN